MGRASVLDDDNKIRLCCGAKIGIFINKPMSYKPVEIIKTGKNKFIALFDQDDVDFMIQVENFNEEKNYSRGLGFDIETLSMEDSFYVKPNEVSKIEALPSQNRLLHFCSQTSVSGQQLVGLAAKKFKTSLHKTSELIGQMTLRFELEEDQEIYEDKQYFPRQSTASLKSIRGALILIYVFLPVGEKLKLTVGTENTVNEIKDLVEDVCGIPRDVQRLNFDGLTLFDGRSSISKYDICNEDILMLYTYATGGGGPRISESCTVKNGEPVLDNYVKGVICLGSESNQLFKEYIGFIADEDIVIDPITVTFQMKTKLKI